MRKTNTDPSALKSACAPKLKEQLEKANATLEKVRPSPNLNPNPNPNRSSNPNPTPNPNPNPNPNQVLSCAARLLRIDAVVPVRCRAQPWLPVGLPAASRRGSLRGSSSGSGSGRRPAALRPCSSGSDESGGSSSASDDSDDGTLV